jgi:hypothetical protein
MTLKDSVALYGRLALVTIVFIFIAGIVAAPLLPKTSIRPSLTAAQGEGPMPQVIRLKNGSPQGRQG